MTTFSRDIAKVRVRAHRSSAEASPDVRAGSIAGPFRPPLGERVAGVCLAVVLGICGAALLVHFLSK